MHTIARANTLPSHGSEVASLPKLLRRASPLFWSFGLRFEEENAPAVNGAVRGKARREGKRDKSPGRKGGEKKETRKGTSERLKAALLLSACVPKRDAQCWAGCIHTDPQPSPPRRCEGGAMDEEEDDDDEEEDGGGGGWC